MRKHSLLLASSLLLAGAHAAKAETGHLHEHEPPEPLHPGCSLDIPPVMPSKCTPGYGFNYVRSLVINTSPLMLGGHIIYNGTDDIWQAPRGIPVVPELRTHTVGFEWGSINDAQRAQEAIFGKPKSVTHHALSFMDKNKPYVTTKARKAARRRAKAGRKASR